MNAPYELRATAGLAHQSRRLSHGPRDFFANPKASDPAYIARLALEGGFNGIAIQIGIAVVIAGHAVLGYTEFDCLQPLVVRQEDSRSVP
jgi:hypothetical protein